MRGRTLQRIWITNDNKTLKLKDMSNDHLLNLINCAAEGQLDNRLGKSLVTYDNLCVEAKRRGFIAKTKVVRWGRS